ncbi:MAG TPA: DUF3606 domain-containing protein [Albitalea sp.]|uniref:DUF3606 domain-containing protein n=1 Tax=Piscinibacter sp. TaxID=1903157 RepID=UPI002ED2F942
MSDDTLSSSTSARIDLTRDVDVAFWCRLLDVDHSALRRAVQHVGPRADAVMRYLGTQPKDVEGGLPASS